MLLPFALVAALAAVPDSTVVAHELRIRAPAGHELAGVLETGPGGGARPTVVLLSGAGAHDRNGYTIRTARGHNDAFRVLAHDLVARGFAVVRYDKVGTGGSGGDYRRQATTATLADDVRALVAAVRARREVDPARVFLLGHSEGGAIAALVAADDPDIAGVALLAAPAWNGRRILEYQFRFAAERQSRRVSYTSADLVEAYLVRDARTRLTTEAWYPFFLDHDPLPAMRRLTMPVLILQGDRDEAVLFEQAYEIDEAARRAGNRDVTLRILPGVTHAFAAPRTREDPPPLSEDVRALLGAWLAARIAP